MAVVKETMKSTRQRYVNLHHPDFDNFDNEMSVEDYNYYTKHKDEFKKMWNDQTLLFWKRLNLNYKAFLVDYGTVYKLRASGPLMDMLLKECWGYLDRQTTKANDIELVMRLIEDGYILVKSRELLPFVDVRDKEKCPFLNETTKKTFRRFFGAPKKNGLRLKVWYQYPLYVKYTGALCKYLKKWLNATEFIEEDTGNYWKLPVRRVLDSYELDYSVLMGKETKPPWEHPDPDSNMWWENGGLSTMMFLSPEGPKILARYLDLHIPEYLDKKELEEHKKEQERKAAAKKRDEQNIIEFALRKEAEKNNLEKKMEELLVSKVPMPKMPKFIGRKTPTLPEAVNSKSMQVFKLQKVRRDGYESNDEDDMEDPEQFYKKFEIKAELVDKPPEGEDAKAPVGLFMDAAEIRKQERERDNSLKEQQLKLEENVLDEELTLEMLKAKLTKTGAIPKEVTNENGSRNEENDVPKNSVKTVEIHSKGRQPIKIEIDSITQQNARARKNKVKTTGDGANTSEDKKVHNVTINLAGEGGTQRKVVLTIDGEKPPKKEVTGMVWNAPTFKELSFAQKLLSKTDEDDEDPHIMLAKKVMGKRKDVDYTKDSDLEYASRHLHVLSYQSRLKTVPALRKLINPEEEKARNKQYRRSLEALKSYGILAVELANGHVISSSAWRCDLFMTDNCLDGLVLVKNTKNLSYRFSHKNDKSSKGRKQRAKAPKNMKKVIREERIKQKKEEHMKAVRLKQEVMRKTWEEEKAVNERRYHSASNPGADESPFMMYKSLLWDVVAGDVRAMRNMITVLSDTRNDDINVTALTKEQKQQIDDDNQLLAVVIRKITEKKDSQPFVAFPPGMDQVTDIYHAVIMAKMLRESLREQYTADNANPPPGRSIILDTFAQMVPHLNEEVKYENVQKVKHYYDGKDKYKSFIERKIIQEAERRVQVEGKEKGEHVTVDDRMSYTKRPEFQELVFEKLLEGYKNRGEGGKEKKKRSKIEKNSMMGPSEQELMKLDQSENMATPEEERHWSCEGSLLTEQTMAKVEDEVKLVLHKRSPTNGTPEVHSTPTISKRSTGGEDYIDIDKWMMLDEIARRAKEDEKIKEVISKESEKESNDDAAKHKKPYEFKTCFYCDKVETIRKQFKQCQRCVEMKSKKIRFYCTKECQVNDWKLKHKDQHSTGNFK